MGLERLDRQMRIEGWNQKALESPISIIGDDPTATSLYVLSAAALGMNKQTVIAPGLDARIINVAKAVNPDLQLAFLNGYFVHREMKNMLQKSKAIVDLTDYNMAKKLLIENAYLNGKNVICSRVSEGRIRIFDYSKGKEFKELEEILSNREIPHERASDPVLSLIAGGLILDEVKNVLMNKGVSDELIAYDGSKERDLGSKRALIIGAGALGNMVSLSLAYAGMKKMDIIDPDEIEETNLNRQVLLYGAVGESKSLTLAKRLNEMFGTKARGKKGYFRKDSDISRYDVIFDCVDNFETRIVTSELCRDKKKPLISGGTSHKAGQVIVYDPKSSEKTPAEFLGLYDIVGKRKVENYQRVRTSCTYRPDPSVIMSNQIIGGMMVDKFRAMNGKEPVAPSFYDAESGKRI